MGNNNWAIIIPVFALLGFFFLPIACVLALLAIPILIYVTFARIAWKIFKWAWSKN